MDRGDPHTRRGLAGQEGHHFIARVFHIFGEIHFRPRQARDVFTGKTPRSSQPSDQFVIGVKTALSDDPTERFVGKHLKFGGRNFEKSDGLTDLLCLASPAFDELKRTSRLQRNQHRIIVRRGVVAVDQHRRGMG